MTTAWKLLMLIVVFVVIPLTVEGATRLSFKKVEAKARKTAQRVTKLEANLTKTVETIKELEDSVHGSIGDLNLKPRSCYEIHNSGHQKSDGVYTVYLGSDEHAADVYCDMTTDGGGWTVFQRRKDGSVDFYRNWNDYKSGFGHPKREYWLGNKNLHLMTSEVRQRLRVDLTDWEGNTKYATYNNFKVGSAQEKYKLASLGAYKGTAGDSLTYHLGMKFSTKDQDNDESSSSCATKYKGAWWYKACDHSNLNGRFYTRGSSSSVDGVVWDDWKGRNYSLKFGEMKIRPFYV